MSIKVIVELKAAPGRRDELKAVLQTLLAGLAPALKEKGSLGGGFYEVPDVRVGSNTIFVSAPGFETVSQDITVTPGEIDTDDVVLVPQADGFFRQRHRFRHRFHPCLPRLPRPLGHPFPLDVSFLRPFHRHLRLHSFPGSLDRLAARLLARWLR